MQFSTALSLSLSDQLEIIEINLWQVITPSHILFKIYKKNADWKYIEGIGFVCSIIQMRHTQDNYNTHTSLSKLPLEVILGFLWESLNHLMDLAAAVHPMACAEYECPCRRAFSYKINRTCFLVYTCIIPTPRNVNKCYTSPSPFKNIAIPHQSVYSNLSLEWII